MNRPDPHGSPELSLTQTLCAEISSRALEVEAAHRLPADLADKLKATGLAHMSVPASYGGGGRSAAQIVRAIEEVSAADGAVGWCAMIYVTTAVVSGLLPVEWGRKIYGRGNDFLTGGSTPPTGRAEIVPGGVRVSGRWSWGSGTHNCEWITGGAYILEDGKTPLLPTGEPRVHIMFFEREQVRLIENWDPSGLIGTGSVDFEVQDAFVPEGRWIVLGAQKPCVDETLYHFPFFGIFASAVAAVPLGIARHALESFAELAQGKTPTWQRDTLAKQPVAQMNYGKAEALYHAARNTVYGTVEEVWQRIAGGDAASLEDRRRLRLAAAYATEACAQAVDILYTAGGGSSIHRSHPLQRCFRDIHVATQHRMVSQANYESAGALKLRGERAVTMF
jgi:indole-3-acetate monooxygenase